MNKFLVYGSLEFGHVIRDFIDQCGYDFAGFVDDFNEGEEVVGTLEQANDDEAAAADRGRDPGGRDGLGASRRREALSQGVVYA